MGHRHITNTTGVFSALVTGQLSNEIREVVREIESLFGTLSEEMLKLQ